MIIIDYSQIAVSSFMAIASGSYKDGNEIELDLVRHIILDSIRGINAKFRHEYGELVIAVDSKAKSWRKDFFPFYKSGRAKTRAKSDINWGQLFECLDEVKKELISIFPYKVIEVEGAEADDIIGELVRQNKDTPLIIISGDKDFIQLQSKSSTLKQWDRIHERWIWDADPKKYLFKHVLKGDRGDGIPNVLSPNDTFVVEGAPRQKPMTEKKIDALYADPSELMGNTRFVENITLIDLDFTPENIKNAINKAYDNFVVNDRTKLSSYFIQNRLKKLYSNIGDF